MQNAATQWAAVAESIANGAPAATIVSEKIVSPIVSRTVEWMAATPIGDNTSRSSLSMIGRGKLFLRANKKRRTQSEPAA